MNSSENEKIYKEIVKDILCIAPNFGKKLRDHFSKKI